MKLIATFLLAAVASVAAAQKNPLDCGNNPYCWQERVRALENRLLDKNVYHFDAKRYEYYAPDPATRERYKHKPPIRLLRPWMEAEDFRVAGQFRDGETTHVHMGSGTGGRGWPSIAIVRTFDRDAYLRGDDYNLAPHLDGVLVFPDYTWDEHTTYRGTRGTTNWGTHLRTPYQVDSKVMIESYLDCWVDLPNLQERVGYRYNTRNGKDVKVQVDDDYRVLRIRSADHTGVEITVECPSP